MNNKQFECEIAHHAVESGIIEKKVVITTACTRNKGYIRGNTRHMYTNTFTR